MRGTPETDAFRDSQFTDRADEMEKLYDFSEKLERERDESRGQNAKLRDIAEKALDFLSSCGASETEEWVQLHDSLDQLKEDTK